MTKTIYIVKLSLKELYKKEVPKNYYKDDNCENKPLLTWRAHANNLYTNWLNYYVYQSTPYDLDGTPWGDEIPDNYSEKRVDEK